MANWAVLIPMSAFTLSCRAPTRTQKKLIFWSNAWQINYTWIVIAKSGFLEQRETLAPHPVRWISTSKSLLLFGWVCEEAIVLFSSSSTSAGTLFYNIGWILSSEAMAWMKFTGSNYINKSAIRVSYYSRTA